MMYIFKMKHINVNIPSDVHHRNIVQDATIVQNLFLYIFIHLQLITVRIEDTMIIIYVIWMDTE